MRAWHKIIVERDGCQCVYCGHSATWDSGELAGNHNPTQAAAPDKVFDITLHECICKGCNGRFSYTASRERKKEIARPGLRKVSCKTLGCPLFPLGDGHTHPDRCWKHQ